jgi:hypothetical protein
MLIQVPSDSESRGLLESRQRPALAPQQFTASAQAARVRAGPADRDADQAELFQVGDLQPRVNGPARESARVTEARPA